MPKKKLTAAQKREQERKKKTDFARKAGLPRPSQYRDRGWDSIKEDIAGVRKEDEKYFQERFTTDGMTRSEALTYKRRILREAGYTSDEATKLRTKDIQDVLLLASAKRKQEPDKAMPFNPFDMDYRFNYAYRVTIETEKESDGMTQEKYITLVSMQPMSNQQIEQRIINIVNTPENLIYGFIYSGILEINSMFAGVGGGLSADRRNKLD